MSHCAVDSEEHVFLSLADSLPSHACPKVEEPVHMVGVFSEMPVYTLPNNGASSLLSEWL